MYNKALFKQAGLDPAKPPSDWDTFLSAARRLKAAGITPLGAGLSDGYCFEAFFGYALPQVSQTLGDGIALMDGDLDWAAADYRVVWDHLAQLAREKLFATDAATVDSYTGLTRFAQGQAGLNDRPRPPSRPCTRCGCGVWPGPRFGNQSVGREPVLRYAGFLIAMPASAHPRPQPTPAAFWVESKPAKGRPCGKPRACCRPAAADGEPRLLYAYLRLESQRTVDWLCRRRGPSGLRPCLPV